MNIAVVGPGALGSLFAALLGRAGHEAWLLDHDAPRAALLAARGLLLEEDGREEWIPVRTTVEPAAVAAAELVLLCVKSAAVAASLAALGPFLPSASLLIAFQNGIGHLEPLQRLVPANRRAVAVTAQGATLVAPGRIRYGGGGPTHLGFLEAPDPLAQARITRAAAVLTEAGIPIVVDDDIGGAIWRKLLVNAGINGLTALYDCPNGRLGDDQLLKEQLRQTVIEAAAVARAMGIEVGDDPVGAVLEVCRATAGNISSMLQDIRRRRPTEIDAINGAIVAAAHRLGIAVPVNEGLVRAVKAKEREFQ
jgi:2-dehydropantoate 2-reductase